MAEESNDKIYTAADIKRYFSGNMLPQERHAIERAALDDPFLAEAMEGYEAMKDEDTEKQLAELHKHFQQDKEEAKVIPITKQRSFGWGKVASVAIVIGIGSLIWYMTKKQDYNAPAVATVNKKLPVVSDTQQTVIVTDSASSANDIAFEKPALKKKDILLNQQVVTDTAFTYQPSPSIKKSLRPDTTFSDLAYNDDKESARVENQLAGKVSGLTINQAPANNLSEVTLLNKAEANNSFTGQVVDQNNKPLAYSSIQQPGVNKKQYADANGNFNIKSADSIAEVMVVGYGARKKATLNENTMNKIVVANAKTRSATLKANIISLDTTSSASPADGWDKYNLYIANNFVSPVKDKGSDAEVELSFTINTNGTTSDFAVDKKYSDAADIEAIRVIQQGPLWKTISGQKETIRVRLQF